MRGRKPTPRVIKLLTNNPGRRPINQHEPTPALVPKKRQPPAWLDAAAKREWRRLAPILVRHGLLTELDVDALTAYCAAWVTWRGATDKMRTFGIVIQTKTGFPIQSPYVPIANRAMAIMKGLMAEFGMTPSSRSWVSATPDPASQPVNPLDRFTRPRP